MPCLWHRISICVIAKRLLRYLHFFHLLFTVPGGSYSLCYMPVTSPLLHRACLPQFVIPQSDRLIRNPKVLADELACSSPVGRTFIAGGFSRRWITVQRFRPEGGRMMRSLIRHKNTHSKNRSLRVIRDPSLCPQCLCGSLSLTPLNSAPPPAHTTPPPESLPHR